MKYIFLDRALRRTANFKLRSVDKLVYSLWKASLLFIVTLESCCRKCGTLLCFVFLIKWSDRRDQHGDTLPLCIIQGEYSNEYAPIMICSYICYELKKASIQTYERMDEKIDERATEL